jgi:hypothetical protein
VKFTRATTRQLANLKQLRQALSITIADHCHKLFNNHKSPWYDPTVNLLTQQEHTLWMN